MSTRKTGRMIEHEPSPERRTFCDQCGAQLEVSNIRRIPRFALEWRAEVPWDEDASQNWYADFCSRQCLQLWAMAGAKEPREE